MIMGYHEFFHESEAVNEMVRKIIQMHFRELTEEDGTIREDTREYVEEMLLEYRNKRILLAKDAIAREQMTKDFGLPEGTKDHDIALHHAIREVEERAARSEYKYFNATEAKQLFALSNFLTSRDMQNRLQLACAIMEVFESDMHRDKQYLFAIEGLTGLTPQDHINDRVSLINRVKLSGKKKYFIIWVAENLQTDAVLRDMIDGIVEKTRMPDITITL